MEQVAIAHRPLVHTSDVHHTLPKWTHTVLQERNFVSEWHALDSAFHLAQEVRILQPHPTESKATMTNPLSRQVNCCPSILNLDMPTVPILRTAPKPEAIVRSVAFSDTLSIRIGEDTSDAFWDFDTHVDGLHSILKPWKLFAHHVRANNTQFHPAVEMQHASFQLEVRQTSIPSEPVAHADRPTQFLVQPSSHIHPDLVQTDEPCFDLVEIRQKDHRQCAQIQCNFEKSAHRFATMPDLANNCISNDAQQPPFGTHDHVACLTDIVDGMLPILDALPQVSFLSCTAKAVRHVDINNDVILKSPQHNPNSIPAHVMHDKPHKQMQLSHDGLQVPPIAQARREHESPIAHLAGGPQDEEDVEDEDMDAHDHPILPAFVNFLANRLETMGLNPHDNDFDIAVRTWYIDHRTVHRWTAPRILQLVGPPRGWEAQVQSMWIDQLNDADWFDAILVEPDPPRPSRHDFVVYDLIITQSLEMPRFAALITVMPGRADTFQMYSVACSLPEVVSGYELVQAADAGQVCRYSDCLITYRWVQIPYTLRPTHRVGHGDGFQIAVHDRQAPAQQHRTEDASSSDAVTASPTYSPGRPAPSASSSQPAPFITALHLFQLDGIEVSCNIMNNQRIQPTQEIADALNVPLDCLEAIHVIPQILFQMPEYDVAAIAQRTGDLDVQTTDRLLLVDVIYHHRSDAEGVTHRPTVVRQVQRVAHHILRQQLLLAAAVHHYCTLITTQCAVTLDGHVWPADDPMPRPVRHGSYAQVIVPPPPNNDTPTQVAVEIAQQPIDTDQEMQALFGGSSAESDSDPATEHPEDDPDAVQLTQLAARFRQRPYHTRSLPVDRDNPIQSPGAVLRAKPELNPRNTKDSDPDTLDGSQVTKLNRPTVPFGNTRNQPSTCPQDEVPSSQPRASNTTARTSQCEIDMSSPKPSTPPQPVRESRPGKTPTQTSITAFFTKKEKGSQQTSQNTQATLHRFFRKKQGVEPPATPIATEVADPPIAEPVAAEDIVQQQGVKQARTGWQQEAEPPTFTARIPAQPMNPNAPRPRPLWHIELNTVFMDEAITYHRETGPELSVEVWYIHHTHMPICRAPRLIRLDSIRDLWYADLCNAWFDQIRWPQPLRVHIVKPPPPYQTRVQAAAHIILEQDMTPSRAAILFTAAFHGGTRMGLLQQAESSPVDICTDQVIQDHGLQPQCDFRPCHMFSGRYLFHPQNTDRIPSGISILLDVGDWRAQPSQSASSQMTVQPAPNTEDEDEDMRVLQDDVSMMQQPQVKAFPKPAAPTSSGSTMPDPPAAHFWIHKPTAPRGTDMHQPVHWVQIQVDNFAEFQQLIQWQADRSQDHCLETQPRRAKVASWYLEPVTLPRSDHYRDVLLNTDPMQWTSEILQRWADFILPQNPTTLLVAQPDPPGGDPDIVAHVLVVQNPPPRHAAALVSVTELLEDPWHPTRFVLFLPDQVTRDDLFTQSGLHMGHESTAPGTSAYHGSVLISPESTYPVRPGFAFEVVTDTLDLEVDANALLQHTPSRSRLASAHQATSVQPEHMRHSLAQVQDAFFHLHDLMMQILITLAADPAHPPMPQVCISSTSYAFRTISKPFAAEVDNPGTQALDSTTNVDTLHRWQAISQLRPSNAQPLAPVMTWYVDHERAPQCFVPRMVFVHKEPHKWNEVITRAWADLILPQHPVEIVPVHPHPLLMEPHVVAHVLVVQQQAPDFTTILLTTLDSALPGEHRRHATMIPQLVPGDLLLALAFRQADCAHPSNVCEAWIEDHDMDPIYPSPVAMGQPCTAAIHRQPQLPDADDPWEAKTPSTTIHRVPLCLQAVLPEQSPALEATNPEDVNQLLWFTNEAWKHELEAEESAPILPLPEGMRIPDPAYWPLINPLPTDRSTHSSFSLYLDGAANGTDAGWSVIIIANHPEGDTFLGCLYGTVQLASHSPDWFGADTSDNISAELTAMLIAQNVAMRWEGRPRFCIRPDLSLSRTVATASTACRSNQALAALSGTLGLWLGSQVDIIEVRGHQGNAWNELADAVAKWAMQQHSDPVSQSFQQLHQLATHPHDVDWAWMQTTHPAVAACFPPLIQQQVISSDAIPGTLPAVEHHSH